MSTVDQDDAPEGMIAVEAANCEGCAFKGNPGKCIAAPACDYGSGRRDGCSVIFVDRQQHNASSPQAIAALTAQRDELLEALQLIATTDPIDAALDPQRAVRVAGAAIEKYKDGL